MQTRCSILAVLVGATVLAGAAVQAQETDSEAALGATSQQVEQQEPPPQPAAAPAPAQQRREQQQVTGDSALRRFGLGIGAGLVDAGPTTEPYFMAALRMRFGQQEGWESGLGGYIEPEVGYWERNALGLSEQDFMVGVNIGGLVMLRSVSYFVAAGLGMHFIEIDRLGLDDDTTSVGVNVQFGVDVHMTPSLSLFGVGRVDLVEKWDDETQAKIYLGLRAHF